MVRAQVVFRYRNQPPPLLGALDTRAHGATRRKAGRFANRKKEKGARGVVVKQYIAPNPDRDLTREELRRYEAQEAARRIFILKQVRFLLGQIPEPEFVPCPIDPRK